MTAKERNIASNLRKKVQAVEPLIQPRGTLKDYFTVYADKTRGDGDFSKSIATTLYEKHGFEYCVLLEVLAGREPLYL